MEGNSSSDDTAKLRSAIIILAVMLCLLIVSIAFVTLRWMRHMQHCSNQYNPQLEDIKYCLISNNQTLSKNAELINSGKGVYNCSTVKQFIACRITYFI